MKLLATCPVCGKKDIRTWGTISIESADSPANMKEAENQLLLRKLQLDRLDRSIGICSSCSFLFQNPTYDNDELDRIYNLENVPYAEIAEKAGKMPDDLWNSELGRKNTIERRERYARQILDAKAASILDYGGGKGDNLMSEKLAGTERCVFNFGVSDLAGEELTQVTTLDGSKKYDYILHTHVLEHETEPVDSLAVLRNCISDDGTLYLEMPFEYWQRFLTRRPGALWHVNYFNRNTLLMTLDRAGWYCSDIAIRLLPYTYNMIQCLTAVAHPKVGAHARAVSRNPFFHVTGFMKFAGFKLFKGKQAR